MKPPKETKIYLWTGNYILLLDFFHEVMAQIISSTNMYMLYML